MPKQKLRRRTGRTGSRIGHELTRKRSPEMTRVLKAVKSIGWLARQFKPPICKQAVSRWYDVPLERVGQVSSITGIPKHEIRPDTFDAPVDVGANRKRHASTAA